MLASLNSSELARRRFREIARVSGLISQGFPGQPKSARQLQASSSLFYEVFRKYDGGNRLLGQAESEVLSQELDIKRLREVLRRMREQKVAFVELAVPSPFALPLMVERFREKLTHREAQGPARADAARDGEGSGAGLNPLPLPASCNLGSFASASEPRQIGPFGRPEPCSRVCALRRGLAVAVALQPIHLVQPVRRRPFQDLGMPAR